MRLLHLTKLVPLRNEKLEIYKWEETPLAMNPKNVLIAYLEPAIEKTVVTLMNSAQVIVEENLKELDKKFQEATK